ncbi:MAG: ABC transporter ATP-binding protein [Steroidobacteraceae bacterium]|jgi:ABC-2 type transport system ATP-binding protein|nr:ABC transporter ATP-binding protein [Steroidobacteraceae bacterium]
MNPDDGIAIDARDLRRSFGRTRALDGLSLKLRLGHVTAVLGPNGAGKTTFVDLVLGRRASDGGQLTVLGHRPGSAAARLCTGAMLQSAALAAELTVEEHIALHAGYYTNAMPVAEAIEQAGLEALAGRRYGRLSGGEQRRVQFALAICGRPRLLVLDEPTVALDPDSRRAFWTVVRERATRGTAVLLTTHQLEEAEALADRIVLLANGRLLADGTPGEIRARMDARRIRCVTALAPAALAGLPGVTAVESSGRHALIRSHAAETTLRALLARDATVAELEVSGASLEDAVLDLIRSEAA